MGVDLGTGRSGSRVAFLQWAGSGGRLRLGREGRAGARPKERGSTRAATRPTPSRLPSLTGLRFVAALLVFTGHVLWFTRLVPGDIGTALKLACSLAGPYGVGFFFVLSGFVLTWTARPDDAARSFWRRRLVKIGPTHLVTFGLAALLVTAMARPTSAVDWLASLTLQQAWFPSLRTSMAVNEVSWSLSCEFFFYLAFPALLPALRRMRSRWLWPAAAAVIALIAGAFLVATFLVPDQPRLSLFSMTAPVSFGQVWFVYFFPPVRALEFVLGILLARIVTAGMWPRIGLVPAFAVAAAGYLLALCEPYLAGRSGLASVCTAPLIAAAAVADLHNSPSVFRRPTMVFLGEISFAFYMVHLTVIMTASHIIGPTRTFSLATGTFLVLVLLAVALGCSVALYRYVEAPLTRRFGHHRTATGDEARHEHRPAVNGAGPPGA
ncbi:acyltransferase family protein [Streptomyces atroolivaceus]|uniref:Acyltransferase family protein n=1 Tax=Streptomyces atroolivaceus TaxID=66869 RepID=A0ABV9VHS0_STRAZ|nr:acyltransferase [Streptomyces atroolivaceus]